MKLCYSCLDGRDGFERERHRRTAYGERCDGCGRIEVDNPRPLEAPDGAG